MASDVLLKLLLCTDARSGEEVSSKCVRDLIYVCMCIHVFIYARVYMYISLCMYVCTCVYVCV